MVNRSGALKIINLIVYKSLADSRNYYRYLWCKFGSTGVLLVGSPTRRGIHRQIVSVYVKHSTYYDYFYLK